MSSSSESGGIESVIDLLIRLAGGDLDARGDLSGDDGLDAVIMGVNMLAEELAAGAEEVRAGRAELEHRVHARTAELEKLNHDVLKLTELGNLLQVCETGDEAYEVSSHGLSVMFPDASGSISLYKASRNALVRKAAWGDAQPPEVMAPTDCWGLRRGHKHLVRHAQPVMCCGHITKLSGDSLCVPMTAQGETIGLLHLMATDPGAPLSTATQQLAVAAAEQAALAFANLDLRETLRTQALRDPLTGLHNRRFVDEWVEREVSRTDRSGASLGIIMADIDHFKQINDVHGHDAGDKLLEAVADTLRDCLRAGDMPCRYGGEEFLILLTDVDPASLVARAETLRNRVSALRVIYHGASLPTVTLSAGYALYPQHGSTAAQVIQAADTALYAAKEAGRNRTLSAV